METTNAGPRQVDRRQFLQVTALVVADRRGRIVSWSPGATDLFRYAAEAMVGNGVSVPAA